MSWASGGTLFDASGYRTTFAASAILFCASAVVAYFGSRAASAAARKGRCAPDASVESRRGDAAPKRVAERDRVAA